jgi:hypothetical protein
VITAVQDFVRAVDARDQVALQGMFTTYGPGDLYGVDADDKADVDEPRVVDRGEISFTDVAADGSLLTARDRKTAITCLLQRVAGKDAALATRITAISADCPSPGCCWAQLDMVRTCQREVGNATVPIRATVLLRYDAKAARMQVFLWHASRMAGASKLAK